MKQLRICALVLVVALASQAAQADPVPYMEVQYTQLPDGNWEYIYDVYGGGSAWFIDVGLSGFNAAAIVNQFGPVAGYGQTGTLLQKWDYLAANNLLSWNRYLYGSYSTDGATWTLLTAADGYGGVNLEGWTIDNTWHAPSEYVGLSLFAGLTVPAMLYPGQVAQDGQSLIFRSHAASGNILDGLIFTFRIVHPASPGLIDWSSYSYVTSLTTGTIMGPVPEPATLCIMGCGAIGLLRRRRRKARCGGSKICCGRK